MVRVFGLLVGLFFSGWLLVSFVMGAVTVVKEGLPETHQVPAPKDISFSSDGPLGKFDRQQLQRGFQVYKEVCAACHSLRLVAFRNLEEIGYNEDEVKAIAANWPIGTPDADPNTGEMTTRPGLPADKLPKPFANDIAAGAANNNAIPPDLSLMTKARANGGPYVYSLLTGYVTDPAELAKLPEIEQPGPGLHHNPYFPNLNLAMAPPLVADDQVSYSDGTKATVAQMAEDVAAFLIWTAEPKLEERHQTGWAVLAFLLIATILAYMSYQYIWADLKAQKKKD